MQYWLLKTEPETFSWEDLQNEGEAVWDGVRNYQARNNLKLMKSGDQVLIYHSVTDKEIVGVATVSGEYFQDPTTDDSRWVAVKVKAEKSLNNPVSLASIKNESVLSDMALVRHSRLSVMPVSETQFNHIIKLSQNA